MKNRDKLIGILKKLFVVKQRECQDIYAAEIVNEGKMTWNELRYVLSNPEQLDNISDVILCWLYCPLAEHEVFGLAPAAAYFTPIEIQNAGTEFSKKSKAVLPVKLPILSKLTDDDNYLTVLTIQEIANLRSNGLIKWKEGMQREAVITKLSENDFVSHIKYDDNRAREIGKAMSDGVFSPNALRWHILSGECDYNITEKSIILKSGYFAEIDGQHRDKGSEYALIENPDIIMTMPIIVTIGSRQKAQQIIDQDEKRAPINKHMVMQYKNTVGNSIFKLMMGKQIDPVLKFCDTEQGIKVGQGFILKSQIADSIDKYYSAKSVREQEKSAEWLVDFLNELAEINYSEFENFRQLRNKISSARSEAFIYYIYISKLLKDRAEWRNELKEIISKLQFSDCNNYKMKPEQFIDPIVKEMGIIG